jgi:hypothetical protein
MKPKRGKSAIKPTRLTLSKETLRSLTLDENVVAVGAAVVVFYAKPTTRTKSCGQCNFSQEIKC